MHRSRALAAILVPLFMTSISQTASAQNPRDWPPHDMSRPKPPIITPGPAGAPVPPPSDAIVLFDGKSLANWRSQDSTHGPARWKVENGYMEVVPGTGGIEKRHFQGGANAVD